jgi:hypothetical protein
VRLHQAGAKQFRHPAVGTLELVFHSFDLATADQGKLVMRHPLGLRNMARNVQLPGATVPGAPPAAARTGTGPRTALLRIPCHNQRGAVKLARLVVG